ncbi:MAG: DUF5678 domain-containing protein [bacterium]
MRKDWSKLYKKYKGMWVALASDEVTVLGVGKTVKEALSKATKKSDETPILTRMPENLVSYVGSL